MEHRLLYPVRRHLTAITIAYLSGVALCCYGTIPAPAAWTLCLAGIAVGLFRFFTDKRALLYFALAFFALGNCLAGSEFAIVDEPTQPNTLISGTVLQIESDYRVMLGDVVCAPGKQMKRPVMVTLMIKEDEPAPQLPLVGQRITGTGRLFSQDEIRNPGGREKRIDAINRGYELSGYLLSGWEASGEQRFSLSEAFRQMRLRLTACLTRIFGKDAPLFLAVILGNREAIDSDLNAAMRLTGTAHILSVSGMHLNLISAALSVVLGIFPIERKGKRFIHIVVLVLFTGLTGCAVGTMRALLMTIIRMAAPVCGRRYDRLTALSFSALLITLIRPLMFFDGGFRFSFFVVLGIVLLQQPIAHLKPMRRLHGRAPWFAQLLEVSIAAQLSAIPMQLVFYGYLPLLALPMNLVCAMVMPLMMSGGWIALLLGMLSAPVGRIFAQGMGVIGGFFETISLTVAEFGFGILRLPSPGSFMLVLAACMMALLSGQIRFGQLKGKALIAVLILSVGMYLPRFESSARYVQIDVGQGDASLIREGRYAVIMDTGPAYSYELLRYLRHEGLFVEALILSHLDEDHAGALGVLLDSEIKVGRVIMAKGAQEGAASPEVILAVDSLKEHGVPVEMVEAGDEMLLNGIEFSVLSPDDIPMGSNERSLLLYVRAAGRSLLLTGDLPAEIEPDDIPDCDILKVAHHGSKNATTAEFLEKAKPEIAIISVGRNNSYGHPHTRVLEDIYAIGAQVFRTDQSGCIIVDLEGKKMDVETMINRE